MFRTTLLALLVPALAYAQPMEPSAPPVPPAQQKMFGVGYKAGNGVGFLGADLLFDPIPHFGLDLQANFMPMTVATPTGNETGTIWAVAPAVHGYLFDGQRSTPYLSVGMVYAHLALESATASVTGTFANVGYEWKWASGLGIELGAGVGYITHGEAMSATSKIEIGGTVNPNIELGFRYLFL